MSRESLEGVLQINFHVAIKFNLVNYKESTYNAGDTGDVGSTAGLGRFPGGGHGNPLHCSCLENPMDRGAWRAIVHGVTKNQTQLKRLSMYI